jgi:hypothetical protein
MHKKNRLVRCNLQLDGRWYKTLLVLLFHSIMTQLRDARFLFPGPKDYVRYYVMTSE